LTWFVDVETASEIAKAEDAKYAAQAGESE